MTEGVPPRLPREPKARRELIALIGSLPTEEKLATFQAAQLWVDTADDGREVYGVLNHRYDLVVVETKPPAPWYLAAYDTRLEELVLAKAVPNGHFVPCPEAAQICAAALGEAVDHVRCY